MRRSYISIVFRLQQAAVECKFIIFFAFLFNIFKNLVWNSAFFLFFSISVFMSEEIMQWIYIFTKKIESKNFMDVCIHNSVIDNIWNYIQFPWTYLPFQDYVQTKIKFVYNLIRLLSLKMRISSDCHHHD